MPGAAEPECGAGLGTIADGASDFGARLGRDRRRVVPAQAPIPHASPFAPRDRRTADAPSDPDVRSITSHRRGSSRTRGRADQRRAAVRVAPGCAPLAHAMDIPDPCRSRSDRRTRVCPPMI
jgi:hypothetical protein